MKHDHKLTYIDMHPQAVKQPRDWSTGDVLAAIACVVMFAFIGVLLAWRG